MAWMGGVASLAALHSCIRAPPNVTLLPCNGIQAFAAARLCRGVHGCEWRGAERASLSSHIPAWSACTGELRLLGPSSSSTRTSQQHRISANLLARRDASPNLLLRWCCACFALPILDNTTPALFLLPSLLLLLLLLAFLHPSPSAALATCLPACLLAVVGSSQLLLPRQKVKSNIASHASAHLQAHLRHLPHSSSAPAQDHSCPPSTFISRRRRRSPPTTSSIGSPALTCCARLDHSSISILLLLSPPGPRVACPASLSSIVCR